MRSVLRLIVALVIAAGIAWSAPVRAVHAASTLPGPFDLSSINRKADACTNFFDYATGGWRGRHPIPAAYSEYGYIEALEDRTEEIVRAVLEDASAHPGTHGGASQKIGDFYRTCMDTAVIERNGLTAIAPEITRIAGIRTRAQIGAVITRLNARGVNAGFELRSSQNPHDSTQVIANIEQAGIGLPERGYYLRSDPASKKLRVQYLAHIARMLALTGDPSAAADARAALAIETALAGRSLAAADRRDPANVVHVMRPPAAAALMPHFAFAAYERELGVPAGGVVNVASPRFLTGFDRELTGAPVAAWRAYLRWRLIATFAPALPRRFETEAFAFDGRILNGTKEQQPRWKRCVRSTDNALGMDVGRVYVAKTFPPSAKARALAMTLRMRDAYRAEMAALPWMSQVTRTTAIAKLNAMGFKVGYPDVWRSYARYDVGATSYAQNVAAALRFERMYDSGLIDKPLDRNEWGMTPQTVNAYNSPTRNEIVLPAAQLQRPFFDEHFDDATNLAATGAGTVGHEMTHGFDDEGHKYDAHGNLRNWWTPSDLRRFDQRANCVITQFDRAVAVGETHYTGKLVAGEAIADLGGVVIGYRALESSLGSKPRGRIDGFTPEQRYFIAFAQSWTESVRDESAKRNALSDPHPLPRDRVNLTLANVPGWYAAFNCTPPPATCSVW